MEHEPTCDCNTCEEQAEVAQADYIDAVSKGN